MQTGSPSFTVVIGLAVLMLTPQLKPGIIACETVGDQNPAPVVMVDLQHCTALIEQAIGG